MADDDDAADRAVGDVVERGWYKLRARTRFDFEFYWDSVQELASFISGSTRMKRIVPPATDLEKTYHDLAAREGRSARLRCRRATMLAVYEKSVPPTLD